MARAIWSIAPDASVAMGTLSVSFSADQTGDVEFDVKVRDAHGCQRGHGAAIITIKKGATVEGLVLLAPDAGVSDATAARMAAVARRTGFPGCDPVHPVCAGGQTCQVNCTAADQRLHARRLRRARDAVPGKRRLRARARSASITRRSAARPRSACGSAARTRIAAARPTRAAARAASAATPSPAAARATGYHTCSASCDPTGVAALANRSGCPAGLACLLPASMDHVACGCPEMTPHPPRRRDLHVDDPVRPRLRVRADLPGRVPLRC